MFCKLVEKEACLFLVRQEVSEENLHPDAPGVLALWLSPPGKMPKRERERAKRLCRLLNS